MTRKLRVASVNRHLSELIPLFGSTGHHHIPIIDGADRLVGIVTRGFGTGINLRRQKRKRPPTESRILTTRTAWPAQGLDIKGTRCPGLEPAWSPSSIDHGALTMKPIPWMLAGVVGVCAGFSPAVAVGGTVATATATASGRIAGVYDGPAPVNPVTTSNTGVNEAAARSAFNATVYPQGDRSNPLTQSAMSYAGASAEYGVLKASALGAAATGGEASAGASAQFSDRFSLGSGVDTGGVFSARAGFDFSYVTTLLNAGSLGQFDFEARLQSQSDYSEFRFRSLVQEGVERRFGSLTTFSGGQFTVQQIDQAGLFTTGAVNYVMGSDLFVSARLVAYGAGAATALSPTNGGFMSTTFSVDAMNSAYWGGLSVFDGNGAEATGLSIRSDSGTDWRQSFIPVVNAVPEPQTHTLVLLGLMAMGWFGRRRRQRPA